LSVLLPHCHKIKVFFIFVPFTRSRSLANAQYNTTRMEYCECYRVIIFKKIK
jgi:hypothetical protein